MASDPRVSSPQIWRDTAMGENEHADRRIDKQTDGRSGMMGSVMNFFVR